MYNPKELQNKSYQVVRGGVGQTTKPSLTSNPPKKETDENIFATIGNVFVNVAEGAIKSIEGIVDAGIMLAGLFGADVDEAVEYDFTADLFGTDADGQGFFDTSWGRDLEEASYLKNDSIINQIAEGVGGMLPTIVVALATGGASLGAQAGAKGVSIGSKVLQTGTFFAGAVGNASESAFQEGATYGQALGYGALSGAIEAGTEYVGGRVFGSPTNASGTLLGKLGVEKFASKGAGKVVYSFASEGFEEVLADLADPLIKKATGVDKDATIDVSQLPKTFLIGGAVGQILDGGQRTMSSLRNSKRGGSKFVNVAEDIDSFNKNIEALQIYKEKGNLTQENLAKVEQRSAERQLDLLNDMSKNIKAMSEEQKTEFFKTINENSPFMASLFENDGSIKQSVIDTYEEAKTLSGYNMSADVYLDKAEIEKDIEKVNKENNFNIQLSDTKFESENQNTLSKIYKATRIIGKKAGLPLNVVVIKGDEKIPNGYISKKGIMYIDEAKILNGEWAQTTAHEITHFIEDSKEYKAFAEFVVSDENMLNKAKNSVLEKPYGFTKEDIDRAIFKATNNQKMTNKESLAYTEVVAHITEELLGSEESINNLTKENPSLAKRILNKIRDFLNAIKGTNANKEIVDKVRKAEKLFENALTSINEDVKEFKEKINKTTEEYKQAKKEYLALDESKREKWLEENNWKAEDFAEDVVGDGNELDASDETRYSYSSISQSFFGKQLTTKEFESGNYKETEGYKKYVEECLSNIMQTRGEAYDETKARKEIEKSIEGIIKVAIASKKAGFDIADVDSEGNVKDSKGRSLFSSLEPNSDYFTSHDISTICDKRKNFAQIYDDIVRKEEELGVARGKRFFDNVDNYFIIHKIMADMGLTQPCRECYVESMRKNLSPMAKAFLDLVQETNLENTSNSQLWTKTKNNDGIIIVGADGKKYTKKVGNAEIRRKVIEAFNEHPEYEMNVNDLNYEMLTTEKGLANLKIKAPLIYEYFNSFYGQSKPKMPKTATPFRFGELTALLTNNHGKINKGTYDKIMSTGGFRLQSYSDFQIKNFTDVLQVLFEAGTLGLTGHAYTKVPAFLDATAKTNLKRNISIFMYNDNGEWKLDRNDSFPYTLEEIYKIVNSDKSGNTGIIAVVQNEDMASWVMANDNIAYFIPFHKSGLKMATVKETIVKENGREIKGYAGVKDHTKEQSEVWASGENKNKKVKKPINIYEFWDFENKGNLSKKELIEKNVKAYLDKCEELNYLPKFRKYIEEKDNVAGKTLKYAKQLGFASESATIDDISFKYKGYVIPYGYYKCLGDFSMFTPDGKASPQKILSLENYDFDKAVSFFENAEKLRREEILQQFANGKIREELRNSDISTEDLEKKAMALRDAVVNKALGVEKTKNNNVRFSHSAFTEELDKWDKKDRSLTFFVGETSKILSKIKLNGSEIGEKKIYFDSSKILNTFNVHPEIDINVIKQIPNLLENPIVVLQSKQFKSRIVLYGELYGLNNKPVSVILELSPTTRKGIKLEDIVIASAYTRSNTQNLINTSKILYVDSNKKRISEWENLNRLQLPLDNLIADSNNIINDNVNNVNNNLIKDSENNYLTIAQQSYFKDSLAVDDSGNLLVFYHGTSYNGTIGEMVKGNFANGFLWATSFKPEAESYSKVIKNPTQSGEGQIIGLYANVTNPKVINAGKTLPDSPESFIDWNDIYKSKEYDGYIIVYDLPHYWSYFDKPITTESHDYYGLPVGSNLKEVYEKNNGKMYIVAVRDSNQFKRIDNLNPTKSNDIRFSLKEEIYTLSDGQIKKKIADYTRLNVYSKVEAEKVINSVIESYLNLDNYNVRILGKTKNEVVEVLWDALNTKDAGKRTGVSLKIADYIIDNAIMQNIYNTTENELNMETILLLKPYLHKVDLSGIKDEIKNRYDNNSAYLLWGKRKGEQGLSADIIAQELEEKGLRIDANNEADIFFEIADAYKNAVDLLKKQKDELFAQSLTEEERKTLRQNIAKEILRAYDENGKASKLSAIIERESQKAKVWKDLYYEEKTRNKAINSLLYEVKQLQGIKEYKNATQYQGELFKGSIEKLAKINWRGNFNESGTRKIISRLSDWYSKENSIVGEQYKEEIGDTLKEIARGDGKLVADEIRAISNVVAYFRHFIETNNKIYRAEKWVDAKETAKNYIVKIDHAKNLKTGALAKIFDAVFNWNKHSYVEAFYDPMSVARYMDKYDDKGFFTQTMEELREGAVNSAIVEMQLNRSIDEFYEKHKNYSTRLAQTKVDYNGKELSLGNAIYVYMALNREQALLGIAESGFKLIDSKGKTINFDGFVTEEGLDLEQVKILASEEQAKLKKQFSETDLEYIQIVEKIFNEDCKKLKAERDKQRLGYTNINEGYYIPIRRANISSGVDTKTLQFEMNRVNNLSFNKDVVKGARNELFVEPIDVVLSRHTKGIAQYYSLSNVIDNYNIIYNIDIGNNPNKPTSIKTESANVWAKADDYIKDVLSDIQGTKPHTDSLFGAIRSAYAKYQLGGNPKVWFTQFSSLFASTNILDYSSIVKGIGVKSSDVDKYCPLAEVRNQDNTVALAQGNLSPKQSTNKFVKAVSKVGDAFMSPIGAFDRRVVKILFGACQVQVQKDYGLKIGTEENKKKAGELLKKVLLETQQNTLATERSQAMRSTSEFKKTLTMFSSDAIKVVGRVIDAYGKLSILKAKRKIATDSTEIARLDKEIKTARKQMAKSTTALVSSAIFMALVTQAFKHLYNKDDEEEILVNMGVDALGNMLGGLPIFKDVYSKVIEGYDFDGYQYSAFNDLLDSVADIVKLSAEVVSNNADSRSFALKIKKMFYAVGQLTGIPVRNIYNVFYGLTNRFSPTTAYKIDDIFYKQSYRADLKKAIESEDEEMIATIAGLLMNESIGEFTNSLTREEINRLIGAGYEVLPQSVPNSVTINEVQYTLDDSKKKKFRDVYGNSITAIDKLVSSNGYKIATDEAKEKAIKYVYKYYYYQAQQKSLKVDIDSKLYLFGQLVPIEKMALMLAEVPALIEKSKNKKIDIQRYLQRQRLSSTQKYIMMGYFGYKNTYGEGAVKSLINRTSLSKELKETLLQKCGY